MVPISYSDEPSDVILTVCRSFHCERWCAS